MSEEKAQVSALALNDAEFARMNAHVNERTKTEAGALELRRRELAGTAVWLDEICARLLHNDRVPPLAPEHQRRYDELAEKRKTNPEGMTSTEEVQFQKLHERKPLTIEEQAVLANTATVLGMHAIVMGLENLFDAVTARIEKRNAKGQVVAATRRTIGAMMKDVHRYVADDEIGIAGNIDQGVEMLNDIGNSFKAFKDKDGLHDPNKYFEPKPKEEEQPTDVDDCEAMEDEELIPILPEERIEKRRKKS